MYSTVVIIDAMCVCIDVKVLHTCKALLMRVKWYSCEEKWPTC